MKNNFILLLFVVALSLGLVLGESELITPPAEEVTSSAKPLRNDGYNNRDLWYHPWSSSSGKSGKSGSKSTSHPTLFPTLSPTLYPTMYPTLSPTYCGKSGKSGGGGKGGKSCSSSWSSSWDWRGGATKIFPPIKARTDPSPSDTIVDVSSWGEALGEDRSRRWQRRLCTKMAPTYRRRRRSCRRRRSRSWCVWLGRSIRWRRWPRSRTG